MREADLRRFEKLKADKAVVEAAAFYMRHRAVQEQYAGLQDKDLAFGFAVILDVIALHLREMPEPVRSAAVDACVAFTDNVAVEGERRRRDQSGSSGPRSDR